MNSFLHDFCSGHPEYGCFISKDKSLINFDHPELVTIVDPRSKGTVVWPILPDCIDTIIFPGMQSFRGAATP